MPFVRQTSLSLLTLVVFLVLTAIASYLYSGPPGQKMELDDNRLWSKLSDSWRAVSQIGQSPADDRVPDTSGQQAGYDSSQSLWANVKARFWTEWESSAASDNYWAGSPDLEANLALTADKIKGFDWRAKVSGFELLIALPGDRQIRLRIPYKLWQIYF